MSVKVSDLTVDELRSILREMVREAVREAINDIQPTDDMASTSSRAPLDIPVLDVGPWPSGLELISREEMYGDDGR